MANKKITDLTALTTPADDDLLEIVDDVAGTAVSKKITVANLKTSIIADVLMKAGGTVSGDLTVTGTLANSDVLQRFDNVAAMAASSPTAGNFVETNGYNAVGDGRQARYYIMTSAAYGATPDEYSDITLANGNIAVLQFGKFLSAITIDIGSGGDFGTIQEAIAYLLKYRPANDGNEIKATINILTGTTITARTRVYNCDCSWMEITSDDATVSVTVAGELFVAEQASLPKINTLFDMGAAGTNGITLKNNSFVKVSSACGVKNAGTDGIFMENSRAELDSADFTGAGNHGIDVRYGSSVSARNANASNATKYGLAVLGSRVDAYTIVVNGCERGIDVAAASMVYAQNGSATGCTGYGIHVTGASTMNFFDGDCSGCTGTNGAYAAYGAVLDIQNADCQMGASPASTDIHISFGSIINANSATGGCNVTTNTIIANGIIFQ